MAIDVAATTHEGHVRPNNEDHYLVFGLDVRYKVLQTNVEARRYSRPITT